MTMPKFVVGCLVVLAFAVVAGGTAGYFFVFKPAYQFAADVGNFTAQYAEFNDRIERQQRYRPPLEGMLSPDQLQRYLDAQSDIRAGMQDQMAQLSDRFDQANEEMGRQQTDMNILELVNAYRDLGDLILAAKRQQVDALNAHGFSLQEYLYVRNTTFRALGEEIAVVSFGQQGEPPLVPQLPDDVVAMVRPHREALMKSYVLAWFGL